MHNEPEDWFDYSHWPFDADHLEEQYESVYYRFARFSKSAFLEFARVGATFGVGIKSATEAMAKFSSALALEDKLLKGDPEPEPVEKEEPIFYDWFKEEKEGINRAQRRRQKPDNRPFWIKSARR